MPATCLRLLLPASVFLLAACGGGGGSGNSDADVTPSLGLIRNATVNFYRADDPACPTACELLGSASTGATGVVTAGFTNYSGPMVVEIVGGSSAEYFDEQSGQFEAFGAADRLRAITPSSRGRFGVTMLTELAYQRAVVEQRFPLSSTAVNNINQSIGNALAPEISSGILTVPALISDTTASGALLNNNQGLYAIKLAALTRLGEGGSPAPALAVLNALVEDFQDGTIDGLNDGSPLSPPAPYNTATLSADLKDAMDAFAALYGNSSLINTVAGVSPLGSLAVFTPPDNDDDGGGDDGGGDPGNGGSEVLGDDNGITGLFNGERRTASISSYTGPPLSVGIGYATAGEIGDSFQVNLSGISTQLNVDRACANNGIPGLLVTFNDVFYSGAPVDGGSCTITTTELSDTLILVQFSGTLARGDDNESAPATLVVTEGEFQFRAPLFDSSFPQPEVRASFEELALGDLWQQGNGTDDRGWQGTWRPSSMSVVDVSGSPLTVTPSGGNALNGGVRALRFPGVAGSFFGPSEARSFERRFPGDVYISVLWRIDAASPGSNRARMSFDNGAFFIGVDSSYDAAVEGPRINQFTVSLGDAENQRAYAGGAVQGNTTHHIVGRLYKAEGSATYNRFDLWVDPARNASGTPLATASRTAGTGSLSFIGAIGFAGSFIENPNTIDRIRFSSTWDGVFEDVEPEVP
ncbi:MAG: hypothetical protein ACK4SX_08385 [Alcanivoracaceae bacterium]